MPDSHALCTGGVNGLKTQQTTEMYSRLTYKDIFYRKVPPKRARDIERELRRGRNDSGDFQICGYPLTRGSWCQSMLKKSPLTDSRIRDVFGATENSRLPLNKPQNEGQKINIVHYIGIAADEPIRIARHIDKKDKILPLVQIGWDEDLCGLEAQYMDMLSPTYNGSYRDGCWFCHNQGVAQLRNLRKNYPDLWAKLMQLDLDSPITFRADGHTVHDFDRRFQLEDEGWITSDERWSWSYLTAPPEKNYCLW